MEMKVYPGKEFPLGAYWDGEGVNFALFSEHATAVELCLFNTIEDEYEAFKIPLTERSHNIWRIYIRDLKPGQLYGYRVHGPYEPEKGQRFNPNKLLIDPYAKALAGSLKWHEALLGYKPDDPLKTDSFSELNSAAYVPKSVVIDTAFDWENDQSPDIPYHQSIIYEVHVKGFTQLHPDIPEAIRGTYAAIGHPVTIDYLQQFGITAIELLPIHHFINEHYLDQKNLQNYWGYNTINYFAPDARYSSSGGYGEQVLEFKNMVKALHQAGIEVLMDVVYNHTAEGNENGPTLSYRGIDNLSYYRLCEDDLRKYKDYTGTGNTLNANLTNVLRLFMDSLRYWITDMHVDGFRFDLTSTLARELHEVNMLGTFFEIIYQDPVISQVKLIAEPWDVGAGGYQVGNFPSGWLEWNGKYRDCIRSYWNGKDYELAEFALRFIGSPDLYDVDSKRPTASVNFISAHDGFTLTDLVSYNEKHNEANLDDNQDGLDDNYSWNCGIEGPTEDEAINALRQRQKRNMLATLLLSQGIPMLQAGDETGRTQNGNNNAYCQDNEMTWINWNQADRELQSFTQYIIQLRKKHPSFSRRAWIQKESAQYNPDSDIHWFLPDGSIMKNEHWNRRSLRSLAVYINGENLQLVDAQGEKVSDRAFYVIFNAHSEPVDFKLPAENYSTEWMKLLDTQTSSIEEKERYKPGAVLTLAGRSVVLMMSNQYD